MTPLSMCMTAKVYEGFKIIVSDYKMVFIVVFVSRFGRDSVRNVVATYRRI